MFLGTTRVLVLVLALVAGGATLTGGPGRAAAAGTVPAQFFAKMYSEALGRMPDPGGWASMVDDFATHGCGRERLGERVRGFYTSAEYLALPYDHAARVLTLYRGALNREPDQGGLEHFTDQLATGARTWPQLVDVFTGSGEFEALARTICGSSSGYQFGTTPAPRLPTSGAGFTGGTGEQLQALLDAAPQDGVVALAQKAVVRISGTLVVPPGRTLLTTGAPTPHQYALQARLVRTGPFGAPVIRVMPGGRLMNVWVDGQRGASANYSRDAVNIQLMGGDGTRVSDSTISNSLGWTSLQAFGSYENQPCRSTEIIGNLVTAYSSEHVGERWTDGLSVACENALIEGNGIIDATDVGIVLFRSSPETQRSSVRRNLVLNAGNPAFGAIGVDGLHSRNTTHDFTGASVAENAFWTGPDTHVDIGLAVGTRSWFGDASDPGTGIAVTGNTTNGLTAVVGTGIAVTGMNRARVQGNDLRLSVRPVSGCPHVAFGYDADGYAEDGDFQPGAAAVTFVDAQGRGCVAQH
ncbi:DUF4214 domain-containing protein [Nonomuraea sp. NPDC050783]|uniref:DUF4214 domain-containing protein n=1 Tax=Nonomuraea sp. NPDC050783 TaxID=3154634 RepID=UPI00346578CD